MRKFHYFLFIDLVFLFFQMKYQKQSDCLSIQYEFTFNYYKISIINYQFMYYKLYSFLIIEETKFCNFDRFHI